MNLRSTILIAGMCVLLLSCKKKKEDTQPVPVGNTTQSFFSKNAKQGNIYTVDVSNSDATITAPEGTQIIIPKNAFLSSDGQPVTGPVTIEVKELLNINDMLLSGITTVSDGNILESGGEVFINATAQGKQLIINPDTSLVIGVPKKSTNPAMRLFKGEGNGDDFNWKEVKQDTIAAIGQRDTTNTVKTSPYFLYENYFCTCYDATRYFTSISSLGWQNIDCIYYNPDVVKDIAISSPGFDKTNSSLFVVLKNKKSAINVYADLAAHNNFYQLSLPDNEPITVIAIGNKDGKYYLDIQDYVVTNGMVVNLNLAETTEEHIVDEINTRYN